MALRLFFSLDFCFFFLTGYHPHTSPLQFSLFGIPVSIRFSVGKAGLFWAFVAQMMDDGPRMEGRLVGAFGVKAV
jgi:hypothetical protein